MTRSSISAMAPRDRRPGGAGARPRWPSRLAALAFGGDYNPEQWPEAMWDEDIELMLEAGVSLVTVGVFSWAQIEPAAGRYDFGWLDRVLGRLDDAGILVDLATPTAAPPPWFSRAHPDSLPVTADGHVLGIAARESYCPSSPDYRRAAAAIARALGERYGEHPALALWHVHNEYGAHVGPCYCPASEAAFRDWLRERHRTLDALNSAWGTAFWSQRYGEWEEITAPRRAPMPVNPAQQLDFMRFSNEEYLACYRIERDILRECSPAVPVTTNFMTTNCKHMDYWAWAREVDVVSGNHYLIAEDPENQVELAMTADLTRGLAGGGRGCCSSTRRAPSTGSVATWPRRPGRCGATRSPTWPAAPTPRCSSSGAPRASARRSSTRRWCPTPAATAGCGATSWRSGATSAALGEIREPRSRPTWRSCGTGSPGGRSSSSSGRPATCATSSGCARSTRRCGTSRSRPTSWPRRRTSLAIAPCWCPSLYLMAPDATANLTGYVHGGGRLVVSFFSGIVDEHETVPPGPHPGALRDLLGLDDRGVPPAGERAGGVAGGRRWRGDLWSERVVARGAEPRQRFLEGPDAGHPAVTRHALGAGAAFYVATRLDRVGLRPLLEAVLAETGSAGDPGVPAAVEAVRRRRGGERYLFLLNHGARGRPARGSGRDLLDGSVHDGEVRAAGRRRARPPRLSVPQQPSTPQLSPSATTASGGRASQALRSASRMTSAGWAPETPNLRSSTKKGTPEMPKP